MSAPTPPRLARLLLRLCANPVERDSLLDETDAEFRRIAAAQDASAARAWYRRQTRASWQPLLAERFRGGLLTAIKSDGAWMDVRHALRNVWRHRTTSTAIVTTLGLASSAALATFIVIDAVLLAPLAYPQPEQLVRLWNTGPSARNRVTVVSFQDVEDWRDTTRTLSAISTYTATNATMTGRGDTRRIEGMRVGEDFERVLGLRPQLGRLFGADDFRPGAEPMVVLTHAFWQREFGADPQVVHQFVTFNDEPHRIVGVLPPTRTPLPSLPHDYWIPLVPRAGARWESMRNTGWIDAIGRLAPGETTDTATAEMTSIAGQLARAYPDSNAERPAMVVASLHEEMVGAARPALLLVSAATLALLVVAFGNVLNLIVARVVGRRAEISVRQALGASRGRLIRECVIEAAAIGLLAVVTALALAPLALQALDWLPDAAVPRRDEIAVFPGGLTWGLAMFIITTTIVAWPLVRVATRARLEVQSASLRSTGSRGERRTRRALVATQVALSVTLVLAGVLFVQTLRGLESVGLGFRDEGVLTLQPTPSRSAAPSADRTMAFYRDALESIAAIPGVTAVAASTSVPFVVGGWGYSVAAHDAPNGPRHPVQVAVASPGFFETLGIRLLQGRVLTEDEHRGGEAVVINERLAALLYGTASAVDQRFEYSGRQWRVTGVVAGTRMRVADPPIAMLYLPWGMAGQRPQAVLIRTSSDAPIVEAAVERLKELDTNVTIASIGPLTERVRRTLAPQRFRAGLLTALAGLAAVLAVVGAYSVTSSTVASQRREQAIRLALGETARGARRRVVWSSLQPAVAGALAGTAAAWYASRFVTTFLFDASPTDPRMLLVPALLLALVAAAAIVPAIRIARVDPSVVLRGDES